MRTGGSPRLLPPQRVNALTYWTIASRFARSWRLLSLTPARFVLHGSWISHEASFLSFLESLQTLSCSSSGLLFAKTLTTAYEFRESGFRFSLLPLSGLSLSPFAFWRLFRFLLACSALALKLCNQAIDRLVSSTYTHYCASSDDLSTR